MGKTAFVLNIAQYVAFKKNKGVAIFSLEMSVGEPYVFSGIPGRCTGTQNR